MKEEVCPQGLSPGVGQCPVPEDKPGPDVASCTFGLVAVEGFDRSGGAAEGRAVAAEEVDTRPRGGGGATGLQGVSTRVACR